MNHIQYRDHRSYQHPTSGKSKNRNSTAFQQGADQRRFLLQLLKAQRLRMIKRSVDNDQEEAKRRISDYTHEALQERIRETFLRGVKAGL